MQRVWTLYQQAQGMKLPPSSIMGLTAGSYEAYCLDQAVWYAGITISGDLEKAGQKRSKGEGRMQSARQRVLDRYFGESGAKQRFADPALLFQQ